MEADHFDEEYHSLVTRDLEWIKLLCEKSTWSSNPISELEVRQAIHRLQLGKAAGIDDISPEHVKFAADAVTPYLTELFNKMRDERKIPDLLKVGVMTPIGKKGKTSSSVTVTGELLSQKYSASCLKMCTRIGRRQSLIHSNSGSLLDFPPLWLHW